MKNEEKMGKFNEFLGKRRNFPDMKKFKENIKNLHFIEFLQLE